MSTPVSSLASFCARSEYALPREIDPAVAASRMIGPATIAASRTAQNVPPKIQRTDAESTKCRPIRELISLALAFIARYPQFHCQSERAEHDDRSGLGGY